MTKKSPLGALAYQQGITVTQKNSLNFFCHDKN